MSQSSKDTETRKAAIEQALEALPPDLQGFELESIIMGLVWAHYDEAQIPFYFMFLSQRFFEYQAHMDDDEETDLYGDLETMSTGGSIH